MARIKHINCPRCGGTLGMANMERVIKCRYCGTWSVVESEDVVPEYYVEPKLKEIEARRALQAALSDGDMPDELLRNTYFHSAKLYFIPYHEMTGRRLGTMTLTEFKEEKVRQYSPQRIQPYGGAGESFVSSRELKKPAKKTVDTRVVMSDLGRNEPAIKLKEWALEESDVTEVRSDPSGMLRPMNRRAMEKLGGKIYDATEDPDRMVEKVLSGPGTHWLKDDTEIGEVRIKRIYYPVWRIRYQYQGRLYGASIDGVTGKIMALRAPQDDHSRILWLLGTTALVSFIIGRLTHGAVASHIVDPENMGVFLQLLARGFHILIPVALGGLMAAGIALAFGWEQFRYPGEIVVRGKSRTVEKINRPERTVLDVMLDILGKVSDNIQANSRRRRSIWD